MTDRTEHLFTTAEFKTFARKNRGRTFFVRVAPQLPTVGDDGKSDGKFFPGLTSVKVSRKTAVLTVADLLRNFEERGARIRVSTLGECVFIG